MSEPQHVYVVKLAMPSDTDYWIAGVYTSEELAMAAAARWLEETKADACAGDYPLKVWMHQEGGYKWALAIERFTLDQNPLLLLPLVRWRMANAQTYDDLMPEQPDKQS